MNLADDRNWKVVRTWLISVGCVCGYCVGAGVTVAVFRSHIALEQVEENTHIIAGMFWLATLPVGLAVWYPLQAACAFTVLLGGATLIVLGIRRRQLREAENEKILREAGL